MGKRSIYFPDDLEAEMEANPGYPYSQICQDAVREALAGKDESPLIRARRKLREGLRVVESEIERREEARRKRLKK